MRPPSNRVAWLSLCLWLPLQAFADDAAKRDESTRWVPSIGVVAGIWIQDVDASVRSSDVSYTQLQRTRVFDPSIPPFGAFVEQQTFVDFTNPVRPSVDDDDRLVTPSMSGTLELMTPGIQALPGRPRFFVHGDAGALFGVEHHVARERAPEKLPPLTTDDPPFLRQPENFIEEAVAGIGSETTAEVQPLLVTAGGGVAFTLDLWGRRFRIKPSVEYMREEIDFTGSVIRAVLIDTGISGFPPLITRQDAIFIPVQLRGSTSEVFQGVGPGLELEMDTRRVGPFVISLFASASAYKILGDTEVAFSEQQTLVYPQLEGGSEDVSADWDFEKDPWSYRGNIGIRFRLLPE
jgi:hypothetical protein